VKERAGYPIPENSMAKIDPKPILLNPKQCVTIHTRKNNMNGAMRLKIGLRVRGMTIDELSERTGIVRHKLILFTSGKRFPSAEELEKICEALEVDVEYFLRD